MNKWKHRFYTAHCHARRESGCMKVAVGAVWIPDDYERARIYSGAVFASNVNSEGYSCKDNGECYKAKITGIYESCEETRKYCKSTHAEINLIQKMKEKFPDREQTELLNGGTVWVTRYMCENCALELIRHGLKKICYCGKQEISDTVKTFLESAGVKYWWYPEWDFENDELYPWWTNEFYDKAYDIVKDRRAPLTIISYNNPEVLTLQSLGYQVSHIDKWPCIIFVRESQVQMYEESVGHYEEVTIVGLPDELVSNAGATRRESQKWLYNHGYKIAFQFDDDIESLGHTIKGYREDGGIKTDYYNGDFGRVLAMWQIAMEKSIAGTNGKLMISGGMPVAFSFKWEYSEPDWSCCLNFGAMTQLVCWNVTGMVENGLLYRDNADVGLDDIDMTLNVLESGNVVCGFPWITYGCVPMGNPTQYINGDFTKPGPQLIERFRINQEKLKENHGHLPWLKFREKRRLPQTCISWLAERRWAYEKGFIPSPKDYKYDIWNNGKLLEEAINQNYSKFEGF